MATETTNYGLTKDDGNEYYGIDKINGNLDKIDNALTPTADPEVTPLSNGPFKLLNWVSYFANRIKAITGKANWWESPIKTLQEIWGDLVEHKADNANKAHGGFKGCNVVMTANQSIPNNAGTKLSFGGILYNDLLIWKIENPTRLTVPVGVSKIKLLANIRWSANPTGFRQATFLKNGAGFIDRGFVVQNAVSTAGRNTRQTVVTATLNVVAGDYFEIEVQQDSGGALSIEYASDTWFAMEVIE